MTEADTTLPIFVCSLSTCDYKEWGYVRYRPSIPGNALFLTLMVILGICQLLLGIRYKTRLTATVMIFGLTTEAIGYLARIGLYINPFHRDYFLAYLITLTIGPVFIAAAIYLSLSRIVVVFGEHISRFKPRTYTVVFVGGDFLSLVVQAVGGGIAASYPFTNTYMIDLGTNILIAGLAIQVACLFAFATCSLEFLWRVRKRPELRNPKFDDLVSSKRFKTFIYSLFLATALLFARTVFRSVELSEGFSGDLANNEVQFMILDGVMVILASICLTVYHPGFAFQGRWVESKFRFHTYPIPADQDDSEAVVVEPSVDSEKGSSRVSQAVVRG